MPKVLSYALVPSAQGIAEIEVPKGALVLKVQPTQSKITLWALVGDESETEKRVFRFVQSREEFPVGPRQHVATFLTHGPSVHVFEEFGPVAADEPTEVDTPESSGG